MSNALLVSGAETESGPPARGDGPAGRLLHAADPGRAGPARPRHRRPGRRLRGRQPVRPARARPGLRLVGHLGRARTSSTRSPRSSASPTARSPTCSRRITSTRASAARWRSSPGSTTSRRTRATPHRPRPTRSRRSAPSTGSSHKRGTVDGQPVAFARQRSTYFHEADSARAFADLNRPVQGPERRGLPARHAQDQLHVQLVLRGRPRHRLLQLGRQPGARRRAPTPTSPTGAPASTTGRAGRRTSRAPT